MSESNELSYNVDQKLKSIYINILFWVFGTRCSITGEATKHNTKTNEMNTF